ncbi:MAG: ABC transporter permease subunit [Clostridiales bacterium]|jgi:putative aldouronate transport system permease protein|nr:ABC transporter permease subunit [Clostridiales bacterium]
MAKKKSAFRKQLLLQMFALAGMLYLLVFNYIPMAGIVMAFKNYSIQMGISGIFTSEWVGFRYFKEFFNSINFYAIFRNTVALSVLKLLFSFPVPILFALLLNETRSLKLKKFSQTVSYLPHFISWVIVAGLAYSFFSSSGVINSMLQAMGLTDKPLEFLTKSTNFWPMAVFLDVWKDMGWWAIIFLAAITGVDPTLYEAASLDGAGRMKKMWHITLPAIRGTITVVLILALGNLFGGGLSGSNFEQSYFLGNTMNFEHSEILQTHVFRTGMVNSRFAYATAVGLIQSCVSLALIFISNFAARRLSDASLF